MTIRTQDAQLITSAAHPSQFPRTFEKEVVFVGKSNVGKSSIINALAKRKKLAYVGQTPGKTRLANFYQINDKLIFVDVPGYGFANRSKKEQQDFGILMDGYFNERQIDFMFILVDVRRDLSEDDKMMINLAQHQDIPFAIILSKADKLSRSKVMSFVQKLKNNYDYDVFPFSNNDIGTSQEISKHLINKLGL
ncbi:MAG TPA: ribosome biogenesis GTP-binding protein YihA/YsxC [Erysipelothrix sp.]